MFDSVLHLLSDSPQAYFILLALAAGDAVLPALPSETGLILAGILCTTGPHLSLGWVVAAAAAGAWIGDNTSYALGRYAGKWVQERFFSGARSKRALDWASGRLEERGGLLIVVARFVPGGRTATTFTCGLTRFSWARFLVFSGIAAVSWALYGALLGYFGGQMFEDRPLLAVLVALGIAFSITLAVEGVRKLRRRQA
jgi:membrane protein DedA with SNARE-associated domain